MNSLLRILDSTRFKGRIVDTYNYVYNMITTFSHTNFQRKISDKIFRKKHIICLFLGNDVLHQKSLLLSNTSSICFVDVLSLTGMPIALNCILHWERSVSNVAVDSRRDKIYFEDIDNKKLMLLDVQSGQTTELFSISGVSGEYQCQLAKVHSACLLCFIT